MAGLANAFNSMAQFTNTAVDIGNKMIEDQAKLDILQMKANLEKDANEKLLDLQQRNDYENWGKEIDNFIVKEGDSMQKASRNQYTAKLAREMLINWQGDFSNRVQIAALGKAQDNMRVTATNTIATIISDAGKKGQQCYDECAAIINTAENSSLIDASSADAQRKNAAKQTAIKDMKDITDQYENLVKTGLATPEDYKAAIDAYKPSFMVTGKNGEEITVDYTDAKDSVKQQNATKLQAALKSFQKTNDDNIENVWSMAARAYENQDYETCSDYVTKGQNLLDTYKKNPNSLDDGRQEHWELRLKELTGKLNGTSTSGTAEKYLENIIKTAPEKFTEEWKNGDFENMTAARDACMSYVRKEALKKLGTEKATSDYMNEHSAVFDKLLESVEQDMWKEQFPNKGAMLNKFNQAMKGLDAEQQAYASGWMMDYLVSGQGKRDPKEISTAIDNLKANLTAKKLDTMTLDKKGNTKFKITDDTSYSKAMLELQNNDRMYTDAHNRNVWIGGKDTETALTQEGGAVKETQKRVAAALGIDTKDTSYSWKITENGTDKTNVPIITVGSGDNEKNYEVIADDNGKDYKIYEVDPKKNYEKIKEVPKATLKKETSKTDETKGRIKETEANSLDFDTERNNQEIAKVVNINYKEYQAAAAAAGKKPKSEEWWKTQRPEVKVKLLKEYNPNYFIE